MVTIKVWENGPYQVLGDDVTVVDWKGETYNLAKKPFALCRCGASAKKPFCDGAHARIGFKGDATAAHDPVDFLQVSG